MSMIRLRLLAQLLMVSTVASTTVSCVRRAGVNERSPSAATQRAESAGNVGPSSAEGSGPVLMTLVHAQQYPTVAPTPIAVDGSNAYWIVQESRTIMKVAIDGGKPVALVTTEGFPRCLTAFAGYVYWADDENVHRVSVTTGSAALLASSPGRPTGIAADSTGVYWVTWSNNTPSASGTVVKSPLNGGTSVTLASEQEDPTAIALDARNVYWTNRGDRVRGHGTVMTVGKEGGPPRVLATETVHASGVAVDGGSIYWTNEGDILAMALAGGAPKVVASRQSYPRIVADASGVYWTSDNGTVVMAPHGAGTLVTLAAGQGHPTGIAVDGSRVYWVNSFEGEVMSMKKPVALAR